MLIFSYKALDNKGSIIKGKLPAGSEAELESKLKQSGLDLIEADKIKEGFLTSMFSSISTKEIIVMCIHFYHLESAGVPILDAIADLRDTSDNPKMREIMMDIYDALKNGQTFSQALEAHPKIFDKIFVGLIKAGERTGDFASIFGHLEHHYKWVDELRSRIKKATYYPIFLLFLMMAVLAMMMTFVIPKLVVFLKQQNIDLPFYTTALIGFSDFFSNYWHVSIALPVFIFVGIRFTYYISEGGAYFFDRMFLNMPIFGPVIRKIEIARFCHFFAITYTSGIGILECLDSAIDVVQNRVMKKTIMEMKQDIIEGKQMTEALSKSQQFPSMVVRMFKVGEDSGNLDDSLENINKFYDEEINDSIDKMVGMLQPTLTIIMGGLMMWITISVFGPIYGSFGEVGK